MSRALHVVVALGLVPLTLLAGGCGPSPEERAAGIAAFTTVQQVLQHPRCQNCHIPGDAPLQFDGGLPHQMGVVRGPDGHGAPGLPCSTCHGNANPPESYGLNAPPGAPQWHLPPPDRKMVFIDLSPAELCETIKDEKKTGKNLRQMLEHNAHDELVGWGWEPGGARSPVPIPREQFVESFRTWMEAGAPCPEPVVAQR
jgi:hypothetical protein